MSPGVEVVGAWWLPGAGQNQIRGRLTYTISDGGNLELDGNLRHVLNPSAAAVTVESSERADTYPRIVGADDRDSYTLLDCFSVSSSPRRRTPPSEPEEAERACRAATTRRWVEELADRKTSRQAASYAGWARGINDAGPRRPALPGTARLQGQRSGRSRLQGVPGASRASCQSKGR